MIPYGVLKKKRTILALIVLLEVAVAALISVQVYKKILDQKKVLGSHTVAVIKKENIVFPAETESQLKFFYSLKPNTTIEDQPAWLPTKAVNTINADGLNDRFNYSIEKPVNTFRIITLGDSFTYGQFVNTKDNWSEQLEDLLNAQSLSCGIKKVEVINLGVGGYDIPYIAERYKTIGAKYNPDLIVWFESGSGFTRDNELEMPIIKSCQDKNDSTASTSAKSVAAYYECWTQAEQQLKTNYSVDEIHKTIKNGLTHFMQQIDHRKVIYFTFETSVYKDAERATLADWKQSFPDLNFQSSIPDIYAKHETLPDRHPNVAGHHEIAQEIQKYLNQNILNTCQK